MNGVNSMGQLGPVLPNLPSEWELSLRILLAAFLGGLIGLEREMHDHPSGLRTHIAVAIGACLFGICSAYAFAEFIALRNDNNYQVDVTRVASQVVVGVGFLGGGAIIKQGNNIRGLTSAAGLWVSSAVGLAVALGMYIQAVVSVVGLVVALVLLKRPRRWLRKRMRAVKETVVVAVPLDADPSPVISALGQLSDTVIHSIVVRRREEDGFCAIEVEVEARSEALERGLAAIESRDDVLNVETG